jgi:formyl-CoA transferase
MVEDPRYATNSNRLKHREVVDGIIAAWIKSKPLTEVLQRLQEFGVPVAPVYDIEQIMHDPHFQAREAIIQVPDEDLGPVRMANVAAKFSRTPGKIRYTGRTLIGQDSVEILKSIGMKDEEINGLVERQIIAAPTGKAAKV